MVDSHVLLPNSWNCTCNASSRAFNITLNIIHKLLIDPPPKKKPKLFENSAFCAFSKPQYLNVFRCRTVDTWVEVVFVDVVA